MKARVGGGRTIWMPLALAVFGTYAALSWSPQEAERIFIGFMPCCGGGCGCRGAVGSEDCASRARRFVKGPQRCACWFQICNGRFFPSPKTHSHLLNSQHTQDKCPPAAPPVASTVACPS